MFDEGKIVIIGASNVGTAVLNKVVDFGLASEVVLIDINEKKCIGESLDTSHATACISSHNIYIHEGRIIKIVKMLVCYNYSWSEYKTRRDTR